MPRSGGICAPGTLILHPRVIILPSGVAESPQKTLSPDLRTNLRHSTTPGKASYSPRNCTRILGVDGTINRNMKFIARGKDSEPRSSVGLSEGYMAPTSGAYALRHRDQVPGSKRNPRVMHFQV